MTKPSHGRTDSDEVTAVAGAQAVLSILDERRFKAPRTYRERFGVPSDSDLDQLIIALRETDRSSNYPLKMDERDNVGKNWLIGFGSDEKGDWIVTTDMVHCSEVRGGAKDDALAFVFLRNNTPRIVSLLEELLEKRRRPPEAPVPV